MTPDERKKKDRPDPPQSPPKPQPVPPVEPQDDPLPPGHVDPPGKGGGG